MADSKKKPQKAQEAAEQQNTQEALKVDAYTINSLTDAITGVDNNGTLYAVLQNATSQIMASIGSLEDLQEQTKRTEQVFAANYEEQYKAGDLSFLVDAPEGITDNPPELLPAIKRELEAYKKEKGLAELPLVSLLFDTDKDTGRAILDLIIERAGGKPPISGSAEQEQGAGAIENINSIRGRRANSFNFPIDKPNSVIWGLLTENTHGQITYPLKAEPNGSKKEVNILYSIDFDVIESDVPIVKRLTQYDKRVYIAAGALWDAGNNIITIGQIYHAMGYTGTPGAADKEKIGKSFTKFAARITINNDQEIKAGYNYPRFDYDGDLLPFERVREHDVINGQIIEETIHVFREPPLLSFARGRKQLTTYPLKVLQSPNSKTERNLAIEDYLLERIAKAKRGTEPRKILLSTLYDHANITSRLQKSRAPQTIKNYLDHYKKCGEIKGYAIDKTSITLELNEPPKKKKTGK